MQHHSNKVKVSNVESPASEKFDLDALLHPGKAFAHPIDIVRDADLTLNEKRAILASWASDACAVEATPELRAAGGNVVRWDDIMDALRCLDGEAGTYGKPLPHYKMVLARKSAGILGRCKFRSQNVNDQDRPPNWLPGGDK